MKGLVRVAQVLALVCAAAFVVLLFANEPDAPEAPERPETVAVDDDIDDAPEGPDGAEIFSDRCASCHGDRGQGGVGPRLADGRVVERFPDLEDQVRLVLDGRGGMPSFQDRLSEDEVRAVVEFTRSL